VNRKKLKDPKNDLLYLGGCPVASFWCVNLPILLKHLDRLRDSLALDPELLGDLTWAHWLADLNHGLKDSFSILAQNI
jgi:hypothetical protein